MCFVLWRPLTSSCHLNIFTLNNGLLLEKFSLDLKYEILWLTLSTLNLVIFMQEEIYHKRGRHTHLSTNSILNILSYALPTCKTATCPAG